jgi:hypothetical protein
MPVYLQNVISAKTHLAEGQGLEKLNFTSYVFSSRKTNFGYFEERREHHLEK